VIISDLFSGSSLFWLINIDLVVSSNLLLEFKKFLNVTSVIDLHEGKESVGESLALSEIERSLALNLLDQEFDESQSDLIVLKWINVVVTLSASVSQKLRNFILVLDDSVIQPGNIIIGVVEFSLVSILGGNKTIAFFLFTFNLSIKWINGSLKNWLVASPVILKILQIVLSINDQLLEGISGLINIGSWNRIIHFASCSCRSEQNAKEGT